MAAAAVTRCLDTDTGLRPGLALGTPASREKRVLIEHNRKNRYDLTAYCTRELEPCDW